MDFGQLLHVAKKNSEQTKNVESKYYSTKFSAPKKESKEARKLSENVKKFLLAKEKEEQENERLRKEKLDSLLAKRDEKSKNKIRKMLKVTKSANKSVLDDAIDNNNTSVTMAGPDQPDEDDYGYVSNESAAFFQKYVEKVGKLPEENKFAPSRPQSKSDLSGTKDRVKAAILREQEEKNCRNKSTTSTPSSSTSSSSSKITSSSSSTKISSSKKEIYDPQREREAEEKRKHDNERKIPKIPKKNAPPPLDFKELLKLAERKQFEPIAVKKVEEKKEPERLLTKKEKLEYEERKAFFEERERRKNQQNKGQQKMEPNGKIPKLNSTNAPNEKKIPSATNTSSTNLFKKPEIPQKYNPLNPKITSTSNGYHSNQHSTKTKPTIQKSSIPSSSRPSSTTTASSSMTFGGQSKKTPNVNKVPLTKSNYTGPTREFPPKDIKRVAPSQNIQKTREFPPKDKTRQFPPLDVRRSRPDMDKKAIKRRRIYDDYDEDEYDSELDDFIEDDPEGEKNVSSYIKEIFGYDKSKYNAYDDDDRDMESNFAQQMREETISKKIGLMEDLEDMRKEAEEKKRKIMKKKKMK